MADIFLSYSSADRACADVVQRALTAKGYDVFWDQEIPAGQDWDGWIRSKLGNAKLCIVLWSKRSIESRNVKHEAMVAHDAGKLLPVMLEDLAAAELPMGFYLVQSVLLKDHKNLDSEHMERLIAQVDARMKGTPVPAMTLGKRRSGSMLPVYLSVAAVVVALVAGGIAWQMGLVPGASASSAVTTALGRDKPGPGSSVTPPQSKLGVTYRDHAMVPSCDDPWCPLLKVLPAGRFRMGSDPGEDGADETQFPQHEVRVGQFALGVTEITFDNWEPCRLDGQCAVCLPMPNKKCGDCGVEADGTCKKEFEPDDAGFRPNGTRPVMNVSWDRAQLYVGWLSDKTGKKYRLPTEAEWEYAARTDGSTGAYYWDWTGDLKSACTHGNSLDELGHSKYNRKLIPLPCSDGSLGTSEVKTYPANKWGLYDMFGNISEWVQDCYEPNYLNAPSDGSAYETPDCRDRVVRGGSWWGRTDWVRVTERDKDAHWFGDRGMGFRVAMDTVAK